MFIFECESPQLKGAMIYIQQSNWDRAKDLLLEAVDVNPKDAKAHYWLGRCYGQDAEYVKMNQHFVETKQISPVFNKDIEDALSYYYQQHYNRGINSFNSAMKREGEDKEKLLNQTIEELKIALMIIDDDINSLVGLGTAYLQVKNETEAIENLEKAIEIDPNNTRALSNLGLFYSNRADQNNSNDDYSKGVEYFEKIVEIDPGNVSIIQRLAYSYDKLGETEKALGAYDKAIEAFPENPDLYFNKAATIYKLGKNEEAIQLFNKVIEMNPEDYDALTNVGQIYIEQENFEQARPVFEKATQVKPDGKNAWDGLVVVYTRLGLVDEANKALEKSKELEK